jgi:hypothetical protein
VGLDPQRLVFIDETWIKTNMAPLRGWAPKGTRLRGFAPHGHWRTMTFSGALRYDRLAAPCLFDGPINANACRSQALVPALLVRPQSNRADLRQDQALDAPRKKRTADEISRYVDELIQAIQPGECKNYFANAGYASIKT